MFYIVIQLVWCVFFLLVIRYYELVPKSELPFHKDVNYLIKRHPEYLQGIRDGVVHIRFNAKHSPFPKHEKKHKEIGYGLV